MNIYLDYNDDVYTLKNLIKKFITYNKFNKWIK